VDGSAVTALNTEVDAADTAVSMRIGPGPARNNTPDAYCSQIIVWDSLADAGSTAYFATRIEADADVSTTGTWYIAAGADGVVSGGTTFTSSTALFTETVGPVGAVTGITIDIDGDGGSPFTVASVDSDTQLTLGSPATNDAGLGFNVFSSNTHDKLNSPFDSTDFAANTSPVSGDKVTIATDGAVGTTIETLLGTVPPSIEGVTVHGFSIGQAISARVGLSDGTEAFGDSYVIGTVSPTYSLATITEPPSNVGNPWVGTDASPDLIYKVD
jgi:hypothetical protein